MDLYAGTLGSVPSVVGTGRSIHYEVDYPQGTDHSQLILTYRQRRPPRLFYTANKHPAFLHFVTSTTSSLSTSTLAAYDKVCEFTYTLRLLTSWNFLARVKATNTDSPNYIWIIVHSQSRYSSLDLHETSKRLLSPSSPSATRHLFDHSATLTV